jgi:hypothetical protein
MMSFIGTLSLLSSLPRVVPPSVVRPAPLVFIVYPFTLVSSPMPQLSCLRDANQNKTSLPS